MISTLPVSRKQMWLARSAIVTLVALLLILKLSGLHVSAMKDGSATVYSPPLVLPIVSGALGIVAGIVVVVFWMQPGRIFRLFALVLALMALYILFNAPTG